MIFSLCTPPFSNLQKTSVMHQETLELSAETPSGDFWRAAYATANLAERDDLFEALACAYDRERNWFHDTYGVPAPQFIATETEARVKGLLIVPAPVSAVSAGLDAPGLPGPTDDSLLPFPSQSDLSLARSAY